MTAPSTSVSVAGPPAGSTEQLIVTSRRLPRTVLGLVVGLALAVSGALLLSVSDLIARIGFGDTNLPVGIVTVSIGGLFLVWLLYGEARRQ